MSDAKEIGQSNFAEHPESKKMEAPFKNTPQWKRGLVSSWLVLKGRVPSNDSFNFVG